MGIFSPDGAVNGGGAKAVAGHVTEKAAERAGKTVPGNDPDDVYGIKRWSAEEIWSGCMEAGA